MDNASTPQGMLNLEHRLRQLEEQARFTLDVLEMASTLGDFQTSINKLHEPTALLEETIVRIGELVHFSASAFFLVDENSSDFTLALCDPASFVEQLDSEVQYLIDNGVFSLAVRENRPITVYSRDNQFRLVLHVLATTSRTRGMFVGVMPKGERNLSGILLSLLSIVLKHCANAIESFELYRLYRISEREQRTFVESLPMSILELDAEGVITYANGRAKELDGLEAGACLFSLVAAADHDSLSAILAAGPAGGTVTQTITLLGRSGGAVTRTLHCSGVRDPVFGLRLRCILTPLMGK